MKFLKNSLKIILFIFLPACVNSSHKGSTDISKVIHKAHLVSGWYPQDSASLNQEIDYYFDLSKQNLNVVVDPKTVKALIVPHAGFVFSGLCAASAYQSLFINKESWQKNNFIKRVVILSPSHIKAFNGISLPDYDVYQTVLGKIEVDQKSVELLAKDNLFSKISGTHAPEHSIEIQLPFLQKTLENFVLVPLVVGQIEENQYENICQSLKKIIDDTTLIVISSDFTHHGKDYGYKPFDNKILNKIGFVDFLSVGAIVHNSFDQFDAALKKTFSTVCGQNAIKILLKSIEKNILGEVQPRVSCYYASSQIMHARNGDKIDMKEIFVDIPDEFVQSCVSYAGIIFTTQKLETLEKCDQLTQYEKKVILKLARDTIKNYFAKTGDKLDEHLLWPVVGLGAQQPVGAFVTLNTRLGDLRGCIGRIVTPEPLYKTIQKMSKASAFEDNRFEPLKENELNNILIDITVLTPPISVKSYKDIIIGKHGVILKKSVDGRMYSSVFLPQVPLSFGWNLEKTLEQLSIKAGLGGGAWKKDCAFEVFEGFEFKEN